MSTGPEQNSRIVKVRVTLEKFPIELNQFTSKNLLRAVLAKWQNSHYSRIFAARTELFLMWLVVQRETIQVQHQEKFWGWVCCISTGIATDPKGPALRWGSTGWGRLRKQVSVALGITHGNLVSGQVQTTSY